MTTKTYTVFQDDLSILTAKLAMINRRAERLGTGAITWTVGEPGTLKRGNLVYATVAITVDGITPHVEGWTLVSKIDHAEGGLIFNAPGMVTPEKYRDCEPVCEHCHKERTRNVTYILVSDKGEYKQVGANCLADFLGGFDPQAYAAFFESLTELERVVTEISDTAADDPDMAAGFGGHSPTGYDLTDFLATVAQVMRTAGWVSRTKAHDDFSGQTVATVDVALARMSSKFNKVLPTPEDRATATATVAWMKALGDRDHLDDYLYNVARIAEGDYVTYKTAGYAGSAISAMRREQDREAERAALAKTLAYVGTEGERTDLTLRLLDVRAIDGRFVSYLHKFEDLTGNKVDWFASSCDLNVGHTYKGKATIKEHKAYNGIPHTYITRAKLAEVATA